MAGRMTPGARTGVLSSRKFTILLLVLSAIAIATAIVPPTFAAAAGSFSDSACSITQGSFVEPTTVYGGGTGLSTGFYYIGYYYPGGTQAQAPVKVHVTGGGGGLGCDSTGYTLTNSSPTGTWSVDVCSDSSCATILYTATFSVSAAAPEFPVGVFVLLFPIVSIFIYAKRRAIVRTP
ncbi:MAG: hypothetical protein JRM99_05965 [Nitrososphaerota archaeon]|nr:hypothetical protein [Nitrososphaerota archaeon]